MERGHGVGHDVHATSVFKNVALVTADNLGSISGLVERSVQNEARPAANTDSFTSKTP